LLWGRELRNILSRQKLSKYKKRRKSDMIKAIMGAIPAEILLTAITDELFERDYTIPYSLFSPK
jgi:hypothetical protein